MDWNLVLYSFLSQETPTWAHMESLFSGPPLNNSGQCGLVPISLSPSQCHHSGLFSLSGQAHLFPGPRTTSAPSDLPFLPLVRSHSVSCYSDLFPLRAHLYAVLSIRKTRSSSQKHHQAPTQMLPLWKESPNPCSPRHRVQGFGAPFAVRTHAELVTKPGHTF